MAELLQIEEPQRTQAPPPQWRAFLELGFRPLYLAGCVWAAVSVALWVYAALRLFALLPTAISTGALRASAAAWILAFALYFWRFFPMMIRPRIDQSAVRPLVPTSARQRVQA